MWLFALLLLPANFVHGSFHEDCRNALRRGRNVIEAVSQTLSAQETNRIYETLQKATLAIHGAQGDVSLSPEFQALIAAQGDTQQCPQPNATMFTTTSVSPPTTVSGGSSSTVAPSPSSAASDSLSSTSAAQEPSTSVDISSSTAAPPADEEFEFPAVYTSQESDPFAQYMKTLHYYMTREDEVCNNKVTDLNSFTEDQLFGYFATLATTQPGPFCSLCHRFMLEVDQRLFIASRIMHTDDEFHMVKLLLAQIPKAKTLCSSVAPGCHENYDAEVRNLTESIICFECTGCMTVTNVIQHRFLLQETVTTSVLNFLKSSLFHNICAELCLQFQNVNLTLYPNGFSYDGCQKAFSKKYVELIEIATVILRPERFCSLEIGWCELNEQPNALHCLRELCIEYFKETPQTAWLCSQIPDSPQQADQFLNVRQTKKYKEKKEYHTKFDTSIHDEL